MKRCIACDAPKPPADFYKHPHSADGRAGVCKDCHKQRMKTRRRNNPAVQEYERQRAKAPHRRAKAKKLVANWQERFPEKYVARYTINNALRDGRVKRKTTCDKCRSKDNVFAIAADPADPLNSITWRCAICHHRGRFEVAS